MTRLACGGKGPCCHVGYAHRHCEHCDVVIATSCCQHYPRWDWWHPIGVSYGNTFGQLTNAAGQQLGLPQPTPTGMGATPVGTGPR